MPVRAKFDYPDLDVLDSPLISSTSTSFSGMPGSAMAEIIFNDPDSWEENNDANVRPISITRFFEPSNDQDIQDHLSKILDAGGIQYHVRPLSSTISPPSSSSTIYTPLNINTSMVTSSTEERPSPIVHSSSITMSFLEWYGIYPESEVNLRSLRQQYRKSINSKNSPLKPSEVPSSSPPPYTCTPSPVGSRPNSRSRSRSNSRSQSPVDISVQGLSERDSNRKARRRRLPSIPPEASLPPLRSSTAPPATVSPAVISQLPASRPITSGRSSLTGPAGPRTRSSSQMSTRSTPARVPHRPPVLSFNSHA